MSDENTQEWYTERLPDGRTAIFRGPRPEGRKPRRSRAAQADWDSRHLVTFATRVRTETAQAYARALEARGTTSYAYLKEAVEALAETAPPAGGN